MNTDRIPECVNHEASGTVRIQPCLFAITLCCNQYAFSSNELISEQLANVFFPLVVTGNLVEVHFSFVFGEVY